MQGQEAYDIHFVSERPHFIPESDSNRRNFKSGLTFQDPSNPSQNLFCHWHARIDLQAFRIHFEWQRPAGQREIKICYVGYKITRS